MVGCYGMNSTAATVTSKTFHCLHKTASFALCFVYASVNMHIALFKCCDYYYYYYLGYKELSCCREAVQHCVVENFAVT